MYTLLHAPAAQSLQHAEAVAAAAQRLTLIHRSAVDPQLALAGKFSSTTLVVPITQRYTLMYTLAAAPHTRQLGATCSLASLPRLSARQEEQWPKWPQGSHRFTAQGTGMEWQVEEVREVLGMSSAPAGFKAATGCRCDEGSEDG